MKQRRLTHDEKIKLFAKYETGNFTGADLSKEYPITSVAINALLRRHGYKAKSQSELRRKYPIKENFFDKINTEHKAYFLGFLYADGYNNTDRFSVSLSLKETDAEILIKLNHLLQPQKPLQYVKFKNSNSSNQYRLVIANKHISQQLASLGCFKAKTYKLLFPSKKQVPGRLIRHFVRGYFDGDGWVGKSAVCIVGTSMFCETLSQVLKEKLDINSYIRARHPKRKHNIRMLEINHRQARVFLKWIYKDSKIHLQRKHNRFLLQMDYERSLSEIRTCSVENCDKKHMGRGYCKNHYYEFCGGAAKRRDRYLKTGK